MPAYSRGPARRGTVSIDQGQFATRTIQKSTVVLAMKREHLVRMSKKRWRLTRGNRPHDAAVLRRGEMVTDWTKGRRKPDWYYLNHKRRPNLEMRWIGGTICWVALCKIPRGSELGFDYGESAGLL